MGDGEQDGRKKDGIGRGRHTEGERPTIRKRKWSGKIRGNIEDRRRRGRVSERKEMEER